MGNFKNESIYEMHILATSQMDQIMVNINVAPAYVCKQREVSLVVAMKAQGMFTKIFNNRDVSRLQKEKKIQTFFF